jgi:hypothetical protein
MRFSLSVPTACPSSDALEMSSDSSERINTLPAASDGTNAMDIAAM